VTVPVAVRPAGYDSGAAMLVAPTAELATRPGARMVEAERLPTGSPLSSGGR
jgi:hypothetical protein